MSTTTDKVLNNLRISAPGTVDAGIKLEVFNVVEEICQRYLQITPPVDPTSDIAGWLTDADWQTYSRLIMDGALARLLVQNGKPWTNTKLAEIHQQLYTEGLYVAQGNSANTTVTTSPVSATQRLMDNLRANLPGAQDKWITLELYNVISEFCRATMAWQETAPITLTADVSTYSITPDQTELLQLVAVAHLTLDVSGAAYGGGVLVLSTPPTAADAAAGPMLVAMNLAPSLDPGTDVEHWIPSDMWATHSELFIEGTLGRMMSQVSKPYSNPQLGMFHLRRFRSLSNIAWHAFSAGPVPDGQTWSFPFFGARKTAGIWGVAP